MNSSKDELPDIACVILAGGRSRRYGSNKAFAEFKGERLVDLTINRLVTQTSGPIAINAREEMTRELGEMPVINDYLTGDIGPLAGVHAALMWAKDSGYETVITVPVDTPFLPDTFVAKLTAAGLPSVASYNGHIQPLHGIWLSSQANQLEQKISTGLRAARGWAAYCDAKACVFPVDAETDPFVNINRPEDLTKFS